MPSPARPRALAAFLATAAGVGLALAFPDTGATPYFAASLVSVAVAVLAAGWTTRLGLLTALSLSAAGLSALHWAVPPSGSFAAALPEPPDAPILVRVEGLAETSPEIRRPRPESLDGFLPMQQTPSASFRLRLTRAESRGAFVPVDGRVWVSGPASVADRVRAGDSLRLMLVARAHGPGLTTADPHDLRSLRRREARSVGTARLPSVELIERTEPASAAERLRASFVRARAALRARAERLVLGETDTGSASTSVSRPASTPRAILAALVLGQPSPELEPARRAFQRTGLAHLLAISGFHVAVMAGVALLAVRLTGERGVLEPLIVAALIAAYLVIIPPRTPILRAGVLALALLVSRSLGRGHDRLATLAWIATVFVLAKPTSLLALGFQLSFGLVAVLILAAERQRNDDAERLEREPEPPLARVAASGAVGYARVTLLAWSASTPIVLAHLGYVATYAVVASVLAVPLVVAILWLAFFALLVGVAVPPVAGVIQPVLHAASEAVWWLVAKVDTLPGSTLTLARPSIAWALATSGGITWIAVRGHARRPAVYAVLGASALWLAGDLAMQDRPPERVVVRLDTLPVGDGTCVVIRTRDRVVLWDAGSLSPNPLETIAAMRAMGITRVDAAVVTHANLDHFNLLPELAEVVPIGRLLVNHTMAAPDPPGAASALFELTGLSPERAGVGTTIDLGEAVLTVIAPSAPEGFIAENDRSLVALVEAETAVGPARVLLTGDIQRAAIVRLLARVGGDLPPIDVLELPHHGSHNDASEELVRRLDPAVVFQSTGASRVADPRWDAVRAGRVWPVTARDGHLTLEIEREGRVRARTVR
ncbi:MAG: ComEC/Rec2 family competence protein [Planctomycetota bacterium]